MHRCLKRLVPFLFLALTSCAPALHAPLGDLSQGIEEGQSAAVTWIYDERSGDVTGLGDRFRDQIEATLRRQGVAVKARREIGLIIDDLESFGSGTAEGDIWEQAGADILVAGSYSIIQPQGRAPYARLTAKSFHTEGASLLQAKTEEMTLPPDWAHLAAQVKGNVFQEEVEVLSDPSASAGPTLAASLDRSPACYPTADAGQVRVETQPGSHVYLLNLAADRTVTLLYPNSYLKDQPLPTGRLQFPPPALAEDIELAFFPLDEKVTIQEGIKVISSRYPLDFSFLPVPENTIYAGAKGGDIRKVAELLKSSIGWSETVLDYWVGPDCRQ